MASSDMLPRSLGAHALRSLALALLALSTACEDGAGGGDAGDAGGGTGVPSVCTAPPVDLLVVLDDTPSMATWRDWLEEDLAAFGEAFEAKFPPGEYSLRVAVALTGRDGRYAVADTPVLFRDGAPGEATVGAHLARALGETDGTGNDLLVATLHNALSCQGPNAAHMAAECCRATRTLDPDCVPDAPPDFLRPHAQLIAVVVSDGDDGTGGESRYYEDFLAGVRPVDAFSLVVIAGAVGRVDPPRCNGPPPEVETCDPDEATAPLTARDFCVGGPCGFVAQPACVLPEGVIMEARRLQPFVDTGMYDTVGCPRGASDADCYTFCERDLPRVPERYRPEFRQPPPGCP